MKTIELDASGWRTVLDFYNALLAAIEAPEWHGHSIDALLESMVWGGISGVEPPYLVRIHGSAQTSAEVLAEIDLLKTCLVDARAEFNERKGYDVDVTIETT